MPSIYHHTKNLVARRAVKSAYRAGCLSSLYLARLAPGGDRPAAPGEARCLYASAVNREGKAYLEKLLERIDLPNVDVLLFCYDDTVFDGTIFDGATIIHEKGIKWEFMKKYVTPGYCAPYDYIFAWDDDIDPLDFSFSRFIDIMRRNRVECAQPGISPDSHVNVELTRARSGVIGRFTDYVENMAPVFTRRAWNSYWNALEEGRSRWGWQHSGTSRSACGYRRMGVIDREIVAHTRPFQSRDTDAPAEARSYMERHPELRRARRITVSFMR